MVVRDDWAFARCTQELMTAGAKLLKLVGRDAVHGGRRGPARVPQGKFLSLRDEILEQFLACWQKDAREVGPQLGGVALAVGGGMEECVDVVQQVLRSEGAAQVSAADGKPGELNT